MRQRGTRCPRGSDRVQCPNLGRRVLHQAVRGQQILAAIARGASAEHGYDQRDRVTKKGRWRAHRSHSGWPGSQGVKDHLVSTPRAGSSPPRSRWTRSYRLRLVTLDDRATRPGRSALVARHPDVQRGQEHRAAARDARDVARTGARQKRSSSSSSTTIVRTARSRYRPNAPPDAPTRPARASARRTRAEHRRGARLAGGERRHPGRHGCGLAASRRGQPRAAGGDRARGGSRRRQSACRFRRRRQRLERGAANALLARRTAAGAPDLAKRFGPSQRSDERLLHGASLRARRRQR